MRGAPGGGDVKDGPREPAHVLDAWIRDMIGELQGARARRLVELSSVLQEAAFDSDRALLAQALTDLNFAGRGLAFGPLQRGGFARLLGRHRAAYTHFIASHSRMLDRASQAKRQAADAAGRHNPQHSLARRALEELDAQRRALNAMVDRAVTWLQDMWSQLAEARANGADDAQLEALLEAAQLHTQALKRLEQAGAMTQDVTVRGKSVLQRRAALYEQVRAALEHFDGHWTPRLDRLVTALRANRNAVPAAPEAIEAHNDFMKRLAASVDACGALQHEERLLAEHLEMLRGHLESGAD